jgi:cell wall-associated NlpC family hydrolase
MPAVTAVTLTAAQAATRAALVQAAQQWVGTPYRHHGAVQGVGVDCASLLHEVYVSAGVIPRQELGAYPRDWHLHNTEERFLGWLANLGGQPTTQPLPGDVAVWQFGQCFSHGGIVTGDGMVIHAVNAFRRVVHGSMQDAPFVGVPVQFWSFVP